MVQVVEIHPYKASCIFIIVGIILCMCPANERRCYNVTSSLIGWVQSQNYPCIMAADVIAMEEPRVPSAMVLSQRSQNISFLAPERLTHWSLKGNVCILIPISCVASVKGAFNSKSEFDKVMAWSWTVRLQVILERIPKPHLWSGALHMPYYATWYSSWPTSSQHHQIIGQCHTKLMSQQSIGAEVHKNREDKSQEETYQWYNINLFMNISTWHGGQSEEMATQITNNNFISFNAYVLHPRNNMYDIARGSYSTLFCGSVATNFIMMPSLNGNIFHVTGPLWWKSTSHPLKWHHNERDGIWNQLRLDSLLNTSTRGQWIKTLAILSKITLAMEILQSHTLPSTCKV